MVTLTTPKTTHMNTGIMYPDGRTAVGISRNYHGKAAVSAFQARKGGRHRG